MAVTMVSGSRATDLVSSSLIKRSVFDAIYNFDPYQTPVQQFFMGNKNARLATGNIKFEIQEDVLVPHSTTAASVTGGSATETITVATNTGYYFKAGDLVRNDVSHEVLRVTASAASTIAVTTLDATALITAVASSSTFLKMSPAFGEGTASATALSTQGTFPYNLTQIIKKSVHMTGTQMATENYGGSDWVNQRLKATKEWKLELERAWIFGIRNVTTTAGAQVRTTGGLLDSTSGSMGITDSSQFAGAADGESVPSEAWFFQTFLKNLFAKGSNEKVMLCGGSLLQGINDYSKVKQQTKVGEKEYGVDVNVILCPFGRLKLIWHPMLEANYANWGIAIDRDDYMKYRFLSANGVSRDMQYQQNIGTVGTDERKDQYLAEVGFHLAGGSQGVHRILYPGA